MTVESAPVEQTVYQPPTQVEEEKIEEEEEEVKDLESIEFSKQPQITVDNDSDTEVYKKNINETEQASTKEPEEAPAHFFSMMTEIRQSMKGQRSGTTNERKRKSKISQ